MQTIRAAPDERDFYQLRSLLGPKSSKGNGRIRHSMRLNDQFRLNIWNTKEAVLAKPSSSLKLRTITITARKVVTKTTAVDQVFPPGES